MHNSLFHAPFPPNHVYSYIPFVLVFFIHLCDSLFRLFFHINFTCCSFAHYQFSLLRNWSLQRYFVLRFSFSLKVSFSSPSPGCHVRNLASYRLKYPYSCFSSHLCLLVLVFVCSHVAYGVTQSVISLIIIITPYNFFTLLLADGLSLEPK